MEIGLGGHGETRELCRAISKVYGEGGIVVTLKNMNIQFSVLVLGLRRRQCALDTHKGQSSYWMVRSNQVPTTGP